MYKKFYKQSQNVIQERQIDKACYAGRILAAGACVEHVFKGDTKGVFQNKAESSRQSCRTYTIAMVVVSIIFVG